VLEGLEDRCLLSNTVIGFDVLPNGTVPPDGTVLTNQYDSKGVDFNGPDLPVIRTVGPTQANSGANVAVVAPPPGSEFYPVHLWGSFTSTHSFVQVAVGEPTSTVQETEQIALYAYDSSGTLVAQPNPVWVTSGNGFHSIISVQSPTSNITSFKVASPRATGYDAGKSLGIDDLTYDNPVVSKPDFTLIASTPTPIELAPGGGSVIDTISIQRINGSTGKITFAASGLHKGVTASFSPAATTSGNQIDLVLTAAPAAPMVSLAPITVTATPSSTAGTIAHSLKQLVDVRPDFYVQVVGTNQFTLPYDSSIEVPLTVTRELSFQSDPIALSVSGLPTGVTGSVTPVTVWAPPNGGLINQATLTLTSTVGQTLPVLPATFDVIVQAQSGLILSPQGVPETSQVAVHVHGMPMPQIAEITPNFGYVPMALQPGTDVTIQGVGFYPQILVEFGQNNLYAVVYPSSVNAGGTVMHVNVPRLATDGPLTLIAANGGVAVSNPNLPFHVISFRNTDGFSFPNFGVASYAFADLQQLYGYQATTTASGLPTDYARKFLEFVSGVGSKGNCFGMSLSSERLVAGQEPHSNYPLQPGLTNPTVWNLDGPNGPSYPLENYVHVEQLAQFSVEAEQQELPFNKFLTWDYMSSPKTGLYVSIKDALQQGEFPIVTIFYWESDANGKKDLAGHSVVAYDLEDDGSGGFYIDVYDNDFPFTTEENSDAELHAVLEGYTDADGDHGSRVHVTWNGYWSFPNVKDTAGNIWTGSLDQSSLYVIRPSQIPVQPHMSMENGFTGPPPSTLQLDGAAQVVQVTDTAGHTLFNPDGRINSNRATAIADALLLAPIDAATPQPPYLVLGGSTGPYTLTTQGTGSGAYNITLLNGQLAAFFQNVATTQGQQDRLTFDPKGSVQFATTAAHKALMVQLIAHAADQSEYDAVLTTQTASGSSERLGFDATYRAFTDTHTGATTRYRLTLYGYNSKGQAVTLVTPMMRLKSGETASFQAVDWTRLTTKGVQLMITKSNGRHQFFLVKNHEAPIRLARPMVRVHS
jgi:hypothetical protein